MMYIYIYDIYIYIYILYMYICMYTYIFSYTHTGVCATRLAAGCVALCFRAGAVVNPTVLGRRALADIAGTVVKQ